MAADKDRLPILLTPMVARKELYHLVERVKTRQERFLIMRQRQPEAILLSIDDFLEITGLTREWIEYAWKAAQQS